MSRLFEEMGIFRSKSHHLPPNKHSAKRAQKRPFHHDRSPQPRSPLPQLEARGLGKVFRPPQPISRVTDSGISPSSVYGPRSSRARHLQCREQAESFPNPSMGERVCLVPYLLRGLGFPIHSFLRGLLEFYGLQLHNFTPASILHIAGYVALCELFLGCEAHFELWKRLFCIVPHN